MIVGRGSCSNGSVVIIMKGMIIMIRKMRAMILISHSLSHTHTHTHPPFHSLTHSLFLRSIDRRIKDSDEEAGRETVQEKWK